MEFKERWTRTWGSGSLGREELIRRLTWARRCVCTGQGGKGKNGWAQRCYLFVFYITFFCERHDSNPFAQGHFAFAFHPSYRIIISLSKINVVLMYIQEKRKKKKSAKGVKGLVFEAIVLKINPADRETGRKPRTKEKRLPPPFF